MYYRVRLGMDERQIAEAVHIARLEDGCGNCPAKAALPQPGPAGLYQGESEAAPP